MARFTPSFPSVLSPATLLDTHNSASTFLQGVVQEDGPSRNWAQRSLARLGGLEGELRALREPTVAFLGQGAAGKSTLLNALLGAADLLPANDGPVAVTQTATDVLVVDPTATEYCVRVQFAQLNGPSSWAERRKKWATAILDLQSATTQGIGQEDAIEHRISTNSIRSILVDLYGVSQVENRQFLERLCDLDAEEPNAAVRAVLQLPLGIRNSSAPTLEALRELLLPLLACPRLGAPPQEAAGHLYAVADRVWITGPFPNALVPRGVHMLDIPGLNDIGEHRRLIAQGACRNAEVILLCLPHGARWLTDSWAAARRQEARVQGKSCAIVVTKADIVFTHPAKLAQDLLQARGYVEEGVQIIHTAARSALDSPSHATVYGLKNLAEILLKEKKRAEDLILCAQERLGKVLQECHEDLWGVAGEQAEAANAQLKSITERLNAGSDAGLSVARNAIEEALRQLDQASARVVDTWPTVLRSNTEHLTQQTLKCVLRDGGTFASGGKAGLIDLPNAMQEVLLKESGGNLERIWVRLFQEQLSAAARLSSGKVQAVLLQLPGAPTTLPTSTLQLTLQILLSQRRRDLHATLRSALVAVLAPALKPESGFGSRDRMLDSLHTYVQHRCRKMLDQVLSAIRIFLTETLRLMQNELTRATSAAAVSSTTPTSRGTAGGLPPKLEDLSQRWRRLLEMPMSEVRSGAAPPQECQLCCSALVTGLVTGCKCPTPQVCMDCYLQLLNRVRDGQQRCPYCRCRYNTVTGYVPFSPIADSVDNLATETRALNISASGTIAALSVFGAHAASPFGAPAAAAPSASTVFGALSTTPAPLPAFGAPAPFSTSFGTPAPFAFGGGAPAMPSAVPVAPFGAVVPAPFPLAGGAAPATASGGFSLGAPPRRILNPRRSGAQE